MTNANDIPTSGIDEPKLSATDRRQRNTYLREFVPAITAYAIVLAAVLVAVDEDTPGAAIWILLPVLPLIGVAVAVYRSVKRADEYSRLLQLEAMALGFGATTIASLILGFLGIVGAAPDYGGWLIFSAGMLTWALSLGLRNND